MPEVTERTEQRVDSICAATSLSTILLIFGFCVPLLGLAGSAFGLLYAGVCTYFLYRYPDLDYGRRAGLESARGTFLLIAAVPVVVFCVFASCCFFSSMNPDQ